MKAIVYHRYGSPDVLECAEVERPSAGDDDVLVQVRAASVNPLDWHYLRGSPRFMRLMTGLLRPKATRLGFDLAGRVEAVGRNVTQCRPGDEVFGTGRGAFAEYVVALEKNLAAKPARLTFEQAAAVPVAGYTALQALRDKGRIQPAQKVLIIGAAGGVGTFAVPIAKSFGADVTGVCSTRNVDLVRSIGADQVVDYTKEDFTRSGPTYDLVIDCVGNRSLAACRSVMKPRGIYVMVGGQNGRWIGPLARGLKAVLLSRFVSQQLVMMLTSGNKQDLLMLKELIEFGKITPVIDRSYPLSQTAEALRYVEEGHARGKVVITVRE